MLAAAERHPATAALHPDESPRPTRRHRMALYLADAYIHAVNPAAAPGYARDVLEAAFRRAFGAHGVRMQQLAESGTTRDELTAAFAAIRDDLAALWRRADAAVDPVG